MKSEAKPMQGAQPSAALFEDLALPAQAPQPQGEAVRGKPLAVRSFVQGLDLEPLYVRIRSVQGHAERAAIDPALLVALRL